MRKWITSLAVVGVVAAGQAAAEVPATMTDDGPESVVTVHVVNDFAGQVNVELVVPGGRTLTLGSVEANSTHVFQISESVLGGPDRMRLRAKAEQPTRADVANPLVSDDTVLTRIFSAQPGSFVRLRVGEALGESQAWLGQS